MNVPEESLRVDQVVRLFCPPEEVSEQQAEDSRRSSMPVSKACRHPVERDAAWIKSATSRASRVGCY